jgi:hypothetical protein
MQERGCRLPRPCRIKYLEHRVCAERGPYTRRTGGTEPKAEPIEFAPTPEDYEEVERIARVNDMSLAQAAAALLHLGLEAYRVHDGDGIADTPSAYARNRVRAIGQQQRLVRLAKETSLALLDAIQPMLDALAEADPQMASQVASGQGRALHQYARGLAVEHGFRLPQES